MATQVTNYQCPACTAPLHFEATTGQLQCDFCGSAFAVEEVEAFYAEKDEKAAAEMEKADAQRAQEEAEAQAEAEAEAEAAGLSVEEDAAWHDSVASEQWSVEGTDLRIYNCPSCGAELVCDETTAATACPYCDNPTIVPGQLRGMLKPDYVIPFKLKKEDAIAGLKRHYEGRPFLPKVFKDENHLQEIKGVYVPFWLFDGEAHGSASFTGTRTRVYPVGDTRVTETSHFNVYREGVVAFSKIPVDASSKMDNDYMDSLEPFDYSEMRPFSTAYLPGFFADKYDEGIDECGSRADDRARATIVDSLRSSVTGYEGVIDRGAHVVMKRGEVKYALLPVWLLNTRWNGEMYQFAMNGQTGKFIGHLPTDKGKRLRTFAGVYALAFLVFGLFMLFPGGLLGLLGM